jgi:predicted alpha/beta-hydrolase family hydrolase
MTTHAAAEGGLGELAGLVLLSFPLHGARKPATERAAHLSSVKQPMLFVSGERDAMAEAPAFEACVSELEVAEIVRIPGADHGWKAPKRVWPDGPIAAVADAVVAWVGERA